MTNYERLKASFFAEDGKTEFTRWIAGLFGVCEYNSVCPACKSRKRKWFECEGSEKTSKCAELWLDWFNEEEKSDDDMDACKAMLFGGLSVKKEEGRTQ